VDLPAPAVSLVDDVVVLVVAALVLVGLVGLGTLVAVIVAAGPNEKPSERDEAEEEGPGSGG
jgi:hypothetical protein